VGFTLLNLSFLFSWFWANSPGFKRTIYCTWSEQANHYTTHFNAYRNDMCLSTASTCLPWTVGSEPRKYVSEYSEYMSTLDNHYTTHFNAYRNVDYNVYLISGKTSSEFVNDMYILKWHSSSSKGNSIEILLSLRKVWKEVIRGRKSKKNRQHNGQKDKQRSTKYYTENERLSNVNPTKNRGWIQMLKLV
jgi:hypothetical protein